MGNLPMCLSKKSGYLYIAKISLLRNWYKIGLTININKRMQQLAGRFETIELVAVGYSHEPSKTERYLHTLFNEERPYGYWIHGNELFLFDDQKIEIVIEMLETVCCSSCLYETTDVTKPW